MHSNSSREMKPSPFVSKFLNTESTIFSMCLLMIAGSALGLTDAAQSSIIESFLGAGLEVELEFAGFVALGSLCNES